MPTINLFPYQRAALEKLDSGSILCAGVGSGKSLTALAYYYTKECGGTIRGDGQLSPPSKPKELYIITTARKRDTLEWEVECQKLGIEKNNGFTIVVDSWNNLRKYEKVFGAFYIFDEQRVVGSGAWVKSFYRVAKKNRWILLSATPGDTWLDYIPVFVANGFYKNRSEFLQMHAIYNRYSKYPKIDRFVDNCGRLETCRRKITVTMEYSRPTKQHFIDILSEYDRNMFRRVSVDRWNPFEECPIRDIAEACYLMRKVVNQDKSKVEAIRMLMKKHSKLIVFYNYDYELDILRSLSEERAVSEWNGHKHEPISDNDSWLYLVQYMAGAEGWNCIETDAMIFYSQNYSYKLMTQAAGRIDRLNTPFLDLYYYVLKSSAPIDMSIAKALRGKRNFNEEAFMRQHNPVS